MSLNKGHSVRECQIAEHKLEAVRQRNLAKLMSTEGPPGAAVCSAKKEEYIRPAAYLAKLPGQAKGLPLRLNTCNFYSVTASRDLEAFPDHVECQVEETRHGDKLTENKIVLLELRIMVRSTMGTSRARLNTCICHAQ